MAALNHTMLADFSAIRVYTPVYKETYTLMDAVRELSGSTEGAYLVTCSAPPGIGKSTVLKDLQAKHPAFTHQSATGTQKMCPIVIVTAEQRYTIRTFVDSLCEQTGMARTTSANTSYLTAKAIEGLKNVGAVLLCLDECQEILNNSTYSGVKHVRAFIRNIADRIGIPFIFSGTPGFEEFLDGDDATSRRVKRRITMESMRAPYSESTQFHKTTTAMLHHLEMITGRRMSNKLSKLEFSQRLYLVTGGRMGGIVDFFRHYILSEIERKSTKSTFDLSDCQATMKILSPAFQVKTSKPPFELNAASLVSAMDKQNVWGHAA